MWVEQELGEREGGRLRTRRRRQYASDAMFTFDFCAAAAGLAYSLLEERRVKRKRERGSVSECGKCVYVCREVERGSKR